MRKDYYEDDAVIIKENIIPVDDIKHTDLKNFSSLNTLHLNKKDAPSPTKAEGAYGTFDDGLLFQFPPEQYKHLTYYCRTSTPDLDTCNVKLFKL